MKQFSGIVSEILLVAGCSEEPEVSDETREAPEEISVISGKSYEPGTAPTPNTLATELQNEV